METTASDALQRLRVFADDGALAEVCEPIGVELLVAHGSAVRHPTGREPADLDLAFTSGRGATVDVVALNNKLIDASGFERIDLMDLRRAGHVARARALAPESATTRYRHHSKQARQHRPCRH